MEYRAGREAADFIAEMCAKYPGEVTVLALAPLTNIALTFRRHPECLETMGELVVLGGAFEVNGNVNPAAEANILGDPEAADEVFAAFERTFIVGLDVTTRVRLSGAEIERLETALPDADAVSPRRRCSDLLRTFLHDVTQFYKAYHLRVADFDGIYVHDPTALLLALPHVRDAVFTLRRGAVRAALGRDCAPRRRLPRRSPRLALPQRLVRPSARLRRHGRRRRRRPSRASRPSRRVTVFLLRPRVSRLGVQCQEPLAAHADAFARMASFAVAFATLARAAARPANARAIPGAPTRSRAVPPPSRVASARRRRRDRRRRRAAGFAADDDGDDARLLAKIDGAFGDDDEDR